MDFRPQQSLLMRGMSAGVNLGEVNPGCRTASKCLVVIQTELTKVLTANGHCPQGHSLGPVCTQQWMTETGGQNPAPEHLLCSRPCAGPFPVPAQLTLATACPVISMCRRSYCSSLGEGLAHCSTGSEWQRQNLNLRLTDSITSIEYLQ